MSIDLVPNNTKLKEIFIKIEEDQMKMFYQYILKFNNNKIKD